MKLNFLSRFALFLTIACLNLNAVAVTVTVNSGGGADATSISDALTTIRSAPDAMNEITITGGGPYEEIIVIDVPLTIKGAAPDNRPIILVSQNDEVAGRESDGIVNSAAVDIVLENLILIPSLAAWPQDDGIDFRPVNETDAFSITFKNLLVTANDGEDQPITTDGLVFESEKLLGGGLAFQDDSVQVLGGFSGIPDGPVDVLIEDVVVSHGVFDGELDASSGQDGFILGGNNVTATIRNSIVSFCERFGFQLLTGVTVNMEGTPEEPIIAKGMASSGILCFNGVHNWSYVQLLDNPLGVRIDCDFVSENNIDHMLITGATDAGIGYFFAPPEGVTRNYSVNHVTLYNCVESFVFRLGSESATDPIIIDAIGLVVAGADGDDIFYVPAVEEGVDPTPTVNLSNSAIVTEGDSTVLPGDFLGFVNQTNVINADPMFESTDPNTEGYLVVTADAYAAAGPDGGALGGYFPFRGETSLRDWALY